MTNKSFNHFISLGEDCSVAAACRLLQYKDASYPLDWSVSKIEKIYEAFENKFNNFFMEDKITFCSKKYIKDINNYIYYYHDIKYDDFINNKDLTIEKYNRRCNRIKNLLNSNKTILFIRKSNTDTINDIIKLKNIIIKSYPNLNFNILFITNKEYNNDQHIYTEYIESKYFLIFENNEYNHQVKTDILYNIIANIIKKYNITNTFIQPENRDDIND